MSKPQSAIIYTCKNCVLTFLVRSVRDSHQRKCIKDDIIKIGQQKYLLVQNSAEQYLCLNSQCTKTYATKDSLRRHLKSYPDHVPQASQNSHVLRVKPLWFYITLEQYWDCRQCYCFRLWSHCSYQYCSHQEKRYWRWWWRGGGRWSRARKRWGWGWGWGRSSIWSGCRSNCGSDWGKREWNSQ